MNYLLWIGFILAAPTGTAFHSSDVLMVATLGDSVTLPCAVSPGPSCSSVTWTTAGLFVSTKAPNTTLLRDCSLQISNIHHDNATTYTCDNGKSNSSVALLIINITENTEAAQGTRAGSVKGKIELHCYLNYYRGVVPYCNNTVVSWLAEDNSEIKQNSTWLQFKKVTDCFMKLYIKPKLTNHHRKWRCQASLNGSAQATVSYVTTVAGGIEEVFAAVGESLSLTCANISSLGLTGKGQTATFTGSATIISKVSPQDAGDYQCIGKLTTYKIRLHTFDITSEFDPDGKNATLTCVLTCANGKCDKDFNLTWSEGDTMYSSLLNETGSLINTLSVPLEELGHGEKVCSVIREGVPVATKKWRRDNSLPGLAWIAIPIVLLCIPALGVFCVYRKRKHNKDPEHIGMTHVYEDVKDCEPQRKKEEVTSNDSFYDLLQAVN